MPLEVVLLAGLHLKAVFSRDRGTAAEDVAVTTHDLYKPGEGNTWSDAERIEAADALDDFYVAVQLYRHPSVALREIRCYDGYNGDGTPGAVDKVILINRPGTGSGDMLPPQCACAVTEKTDSRRHWGRFYMPGLSEGNNQADGTLLASAVDAIADAAKVLYDRWSNPPDEGAVVWSRITAESDFNIVAPPFPFPSWLYPDPPVTELVIGARAVQQVQVDDIVDIIRRRRWQQSLNRQVRNVA